MYAKQGIRLIIIIIVIVFLSGCASYHYRKVQEGELHGKLIVEWIDYDEFIFKPDKENPLTFIRHNDEKITPQSIYTDGGSIPRIFWAFRSYSPWGYAPAFIIHDWLFETKHCGIPGYEDYDVKEAAWVMSEVMKTLMEDPKYGGKNEFVLYSMYKGVSSSIAEGLWNVGTCDIHTEEELEQLKAGLVGPSRQYVIEFP